MQKSTSGFTLSELLIINPINPTVAFSIGDRFLSIMMDSILSQFENGWFEGTVTATY